jgi:hypothetical protein
MEEQQRKQLGRKYFLEMKQNCYSLYSVYVFREEEKL